MKNIVEWFASGGLVVLFGLLWRSNYTREQSIARVYQRLDEAKEGIKKDFVSKDVCKVVHQDSLRQFIEIKDSMKSLHEKLDRLHHG